MLVSFLVVVFVLTVALIVYKIISFMMKKASEESTKILNECKTEEERQFALKNLQKKNIKKGLIFYPIVMGGIVFITFLVMLFLRICMK